MTEQEKRRRLAAQKRKKQLRNRRMAAAAGILLVLLLCVVVIAGIRLRKTDPGNPPADEEAVTPDEEAVTPDEEAAAPDENAQSAETADISGTDDQEGTAGEGEIAETETAEETVPEGPSLLTFSEADTRAGDLILVNRTYAYDFEANEADLNLTNIREGQSFYYQVGNTSMAVAGRILGPLDQLVAACNQAVGSELTGIESAHRSLDYQQRVWNEMEDLYGRSYCETYVATPGYSEHHTGLAVDMGIFYPDGSEGSFSESGNAVWMRENSCHYGFIRRYASDKAGITGFSNEAWHFRYVGIPHAVYMTQNNLCLEEYIQKLTNETGPETPLTFEADGNTYSVYYTADLTIAEPEGEYSVSGTNTGGLIVTVKH